MTRALILSNGSLMVNFDEDYQLRDVYYPQLAGHNQTLGGLSRTGIWADGHFAWLSTWQLSIRYQPEAMISEVHAANPPLGLQCTINDAIDPLNNLLLRRFRIKNMLGQQREVRLFAHFDPYIGGSALDNHAWHDPARRALLFHKDDICFLLASSPACSGYAVSNKGVSGSPGSWRDATDGELQNTAAATGAVDGTIMCELSLGPNQEGEAWIWLVVADNPEQAVAWHDISHGKPQEVLERSADAWRFWLASSRRDFAALPPAVTRVYRRSLMVLYTQVSNAGTVMPGEAPDDSGAALVDSVRVASTMLVAGYPDLAQQIIAALIGEGAEHDGAALVKQTLRPWLARSGSGLLRAQARQAEIALLVSLLCSFIGRLDDAALRGRVYDKLIRPATRLILAFLDPDSGLPQPAHDVWGRFEGIALSTCCSIYSSLQGAARLSRALGQAGDADTWEKAAEILKATVVVRFYVPELGRFVPYLRETADRQYSPSYIFDMDCAALFMFGLLPAGDPRIVATMQTTIEQLRNNTGIGGYARNNSDFADLAADPSVAGYSCLRSAIWLARWYLMLGRKAEVTELINWCAAQALPTGLLPEQVDPLSGEPHGQTPSLVAHGAFVNLVEQYLASRSS